MVMDNNVSVNGKGGIVIETTIAGPDQVNASENRIIGNTISGNGGDPANPGSSDIKTGISINADGLISDTMILANRFDDEQVDVVFGSLQPSTMLHLNNFAPPWGTHTLMGVVSDSANWWNCATGPVIGSSQNTPNGPCAVDVNRDPDLNVYPWLTQPFGYQYAHENDHDGDKDK